VDQQAAVFAYAAPDRRQPESKPKSKRVAHLENEIPLKQ
jgi:hypothetical protein